jgi:hypothetical protein
MTSRKPVSGALPLIPVLARALLLLAPGIGPAAAGEVALDPARVGWSEIRMSASVLFLTAESRLSLRTVPGTAVAPDLLAIGAAGFTGLKAGPDVLELLYDTRGAGRKSRVTLLMDPVSGAALQQTQEDEGPKPRLRVYRFGSQGAYQRTRWPATPAEQKLPPSRWTRTSEGLRAYPVLPGRQPVVETTGLLYAVAAAPLDRPGDRADFLIFRRRDTQTVRVEVLSARAITVRYDELWPRGAVQRTGTVEALRLSLKGLPVPGGDPEDDDLELLGLKGQLELLLEPTTRAPLQLSGNVKIVGRVTLRLDEVRPR